MTYLPSPSCNGECSPDLDLLPLLYPLGWPIAASLILFAVLALRRRSGVGTAVGLGCGFWVLIWFLCLSLVPRYYSSAVLVIGVPIVAYGLAGALCELWSRWWDRRRSSSSPHGEVTGDSP